MLATSIVSWTSLREYWRTYKSTVRRRPLNRSRSPYKEFSGGCSSTATRRSSKRPGNSAKSGPEACAYRSPWARRWLSRGDWVCSLGEAAREIWDPRRRMSHVWDG
jgi:hypothetical protein